MKRMKTLNRVLLAFLILMMAAARSFAVDIVAVSPWVTVLTYFIGGVKVNVTPLTTWENDRVSRSKIRNIQNTNPNILALDVSEVKKIGLDAENYSNIRLLYENAPFEARESDKYFGDPSVLPFIAQRLLPVLSSLDPDNFPYYQRRLAEFQTRLSSTVLAGRNLLKGQKILDLTCSNGYFLSAAGCDISKPGEEDIAAWSKYKQIDKLHELVTESQKENRLVIIGDATPKSIKTVLSSFQKIIILPYPPLDQDFLTFMHNQYLIIWNEFKDQVVNEKI